MLELLTQSKNTIYNAKIQDHNIHRRRKQLYIGGAWPTRREPLFSNIHEFRIYAVRAMQMCHHVRKV